jgi:maleylacetoacetate isomerase
MKLYSYFRSSAAYRVRIALNLKGLAYDTVPVNLLQTEQQSTDYLAKNPQGLVPALELDDGSVLAQSVAILEWLEESHPQPALLPADPLARARVRAVVGSLACDIHPLNNLAVLTYLKGPLTADEGQVKTWYATWVARGFRAIEQVLAREAGAFCFGDSPTLADCCLVPQVFNARRFEVPLGDYPTISRVADHCDTLEPFRAAMPSRQPDATA